MCRLVIGRRAARDALPGRSQTTFFDAADRSPITSRDITQRIYLLEHARLSQENIFHVEGSGHYHVWIKS